MPKTRILEIDGTGKVLASSISNTVFFPFYLEEKGSVKDPQLISSVKELEGYFTEGNAEKKSGLYYRICAHLIRIGFDVIVGVYSSNGMNENDWEILKDRNLFDIRFITTGEKSGLDQSAISCAKDRGDAVALLSFDESNSNFNYTVGKIRESISISDGEYAAIFTPWFKSLNSDLVGSDGTEVEIPAAFGYLFAYAQSIKNNPAWYAVAGPERGIIPELSSVKKNYSTAEVEILGARSVHENVDLDNSEDNVGVAVNAICYVRPSGYILYGNRTAKNNDGVKHLTAQSFLNIRNGVSGIKKVMYEASNMFRFEPNTEALWINFTSYCEPLLDKMKSGNGLLDFRWTRIHTDAKARVKARLNIIPIEGVEDFDLEVYLTDDLTVNEG